MFSRSSWRSCQTQCHYHLYVENSKTLAFSVKMGVMRVNWSFMLSFLVCVLQEAAGGGGWEFWLGQCRTRVASVFCESVCVMRVWVGVIRVPLARSAFYFLSVTVLCLVLCLYAVLVFTRTPKPSKRVSTNERQLCPLPASIWADDRVQRFASMTLCWIRTAKLK